MSKKIRSIIFSLLGLAYAGSAYAQSYCGGQLVYSQDCASNGRDYAVSCCPDGYRVQGVASGDKYKQDYGDAISAVCRSITKGNDMMPIDFQRAPAAYVCDKTEVFAGLFCKDMGDRGKGTKSDVLDGCTAVCQKPNSGDLREVYSPDISHNPRQGIRHTVKLPKRVVGLAYKDMDNAGGESDRADCAAIIVK